LTMLRWLHENGCPWDETIAESAAAIGHLTILKYLYENGCDLGGILEHAVKNNRFGIIEWIRTISYDL